MWHFSFIDFKLLERDVVLSKRDKKYDSHLRAENNIRINRCCHVRDISREFFKNRSTRNIQWNIFLNKCNNDTDEFTIHISSRFLSFILKIWTTWEGKKNSRATFILHWSKSKSTFIIQCNRVTSCFAVSLIFKNEYFTCLEKMVSVIRFAFRVYKYYRII